MKHQLIPMMMLFVSSAYGQVFHVKEMNTEQLRKMNRSKTVVFLTVGILEEHGPYMPSFTDGYAAERHTLDIANAIVERPGWQVLIFPTVPLGSRVRQTRSAGSSPLMEVIPSARPR